MGTAPASEQAVKNTRSRRRIPGVCAAAIARAWMRRRMVGSSPHHGASVVACGQPLSRQAARAWALRALGTRYPVAAHRTAGSRPPDSPTRAGRNCADGSLAAMPVVARSSPGSKAVHGIDDDANSTTCNRSSLQLRLRSHHGAASAAPLQRSRTQHARAMLAPASPTARVTSSVERTTSSAQDGGRARRDTTPGEKNGQQEAGPNATLTYSSLALLSREQNAVQAWTPVS